MSKHPPKDRSPWPFKPHPVDPKLKARLHAAVQQLPHSPDFRAMVQQMVLDHASRMAMQWLLEVPGRRLEATHVIDTEGGEPGHGLEIKFFGADGTECDPTEGTPDQ